ncbi:zinc finger C2HC domain-containing protein 1A-like isoform X2 [Symsagittifera roscoffensis]|uniref:zinc finger C2HC domain-containing protein 1A-like isoform X2 n=1 Tax=Symsagittifera roscoffensis TaxID=84072 RepID=UPI00307B9280
MEANNTVPCKNCGRTFNPDVLSKHAPICAKNAKKKRKVFDSGKQRAAGSDVPISAVLKPGQAPKKEPARYQKAHEATRNNWKYKHEQLVDGMRAARGAPPMKSSGGSAPPPTMNPGMEACRYCARTFNRERVEKHEQICGEQTKRAQKDIGNKTRGGMAARGGPSRGAAMTASRNPPPGSSGATSRDIGALSSSMKPSPSASASLRGGSTKAGSPVGSRPAQGGGRAAPSGSRGQERPGMAQQRGGGSSTQNTTNGRSQYANVPSSGGASRQAPPAAGGGSGGGGGPKFCGSCGTKFSGTTAKFCYECGAQRGR